MSQWKLLFVLDNEYRGSHNQPERVMVENVETPTFAVFYYTNIRLCSFQMQLYIAPQDILKVGNCSFFK